MRIKTNKSLLVGPVHLEEMRLIWIIRECNKREKKDKKTWDV